MVQYLYTIKCVYFIYEKVKRQAVGRDNILGGGQLLLLTPSSAAIGIATHRIYQTR